MHRSVTVLGAGCMVALLSCLRLPCETYVIQRIPSPNGELEGVVFDRRCGATSGFNTQLSIVVPGATPDEPGNALIVDADHGLAPVGPAGGPEIQVVWQGDSMLHVRLDRRARSFKQDTIVEGVRVVYELTAR
jgi:hypothetical protein